MDEIQKALTHLKKDPIMKKLIEKHPIPEWSSDTNIFLHLVDSIISQQLSVKAGNTIYGRFKDLFPDNIPTPENILQLSDDQIRACGISYPKIKYLKGLAQAIQDGLLHVDDLIALDDEKVIEELIKIKGIGKWTAEMTLIFSLKRPDIFSVGDLGLCNAVAKLYNVDRNDKKKIEKISQKWKPHRSLACRYLWMSLDNV